MRKVRLTDSEKRRQVEYFLGMGFLSAQDDSIKHECATIKMLREGAEIPSIEKTEREIRAMVKKGDVQECPQHPGRYMITAQLLKRWGLVK
jgi:hypothetical protein